MPEELTIEVIEAGKRAADVINLHLLYGKREDIRNQWIAIKLEDGRSDNVLYDSCEDCVKHQTFEQQCWYVSFRGLSPAGFTAKDCAIQIMFWRRAYEKGMRFIDPDKRLRAPMMTAGQYDYYDSMVKQESIMIAARQFGIERLGRSN